MFIIFPPKMVELGYKNVIPHVMWYNDLRVKKAVRSVWTSEILRCFVSTTACYPHDSWRDLLHTHSLTQVASAFRSPRTLIGPRTCPSYFPDLNAYRIGQSAASDSSASAIGQKTRLVVRQAWRWRETGSPIENRLCHRSVGCYYILPAAFNG